MSSDLDNRTLGELRLEWKTSIAQHGRKPVSWKDLAVLLDDLLQDRLALEARIAALEARPLPTHRGAHQDGKGYPANSLVTHSGSLWVSMMSTTSVPGTDPSWQLAVKKSEAR